MGINTIVNKEPVILSQMDHQARKENQIRWAQPILLKLHRKQEYGACGAVHPPVSVTCSSGTDGTDPQQQVPESGYLDDRERILVGKGHERDKKMVCDLFLSGGSRGLYNRPNSSN